MADKYYWLKLKRDFFKRHDVKILEAKPDGKEYVLFYLKLLCESVDHEGNLRFSDDVPYTTEMFAAITGTDVEIVDSAIDVLIELGLMTISDDKTYHMSKVCKMIGSATDNDNARRQKRFRDRQKEQKNSQCVTENNASVTDSVTDSVTERYASVTNSNESKSKSKSKNNNISSSILEEEFEQLWSLYPKKQGKKRAFEAYKRARKKGVACEDVEAGIRAYLKHIELCKTEFQFIKQGSTYFSQEAWTDSYPQAEVGQIDDDLDGIL